MIDYEKVVYYLRDKKIFSVPQMQLELGFGYLTALRVMERLEAVGAVTYLGGNKYEFKPIGKSSAAAPERGRLRPFRTLKNNRFNDDDDDDQPLYKPFDDLDDDLDDDIDNELDDLDDIDNELDDMDDDDPPLFNPFESREEEKVEGKRTLGDLKAKMEELKARIAARETEKKAEISRLACCLKNIAQKKSGKISPHTVPEHSLWTFQDLTAAMDERINKLILSDKTLTKTKAVALAENYLEAVRDTHDGKMMQLYERLVYELKNFSVSRFNRLKKFLYGGG